MFSALKYFLLEVGGRVLRLSKQTFTRLRKFLQLTRFTGYTNSNNFWEESKWAELTSGRSGHSRDRNSLF